MSILPVSQTFASSADLEHVQRGTSIPRSASNVDKARCVRLTQVEANLVSQEEILRQLKLLCQTLDAACATKNFDRFVGEETCNQCLTAVCKEFGFALARKASFLTDGGIGVHVTKGILRRHSLAAIYPGTVYKLGEPVFLQSLANSYVFRCADGTTIDGNNRGLSRLIYNSCTYRDRVGQYLHSDLTWMTQFSANSLNIGQYVNNGTKECPANVAYHEFDLPLVALQSRLRRFIPNVHYSSLIDHKFLRMIVLIAQRDIQAGEELYSSYFTAVL